MRYMGDEIMKYRKKPVVIEAKRWSGGSDKYKEIIEWSGQAWNITFPERKLEIPTLEGTMTADVDDYIIKGVNGEFYPCKPDIFEKSYEPA